jgi:hypothetical protein
MAYILLTLCSLCNSQQRFSGFWFELLAIILGRVLGYLWLAQYI